MYPTHLVSFHSSYIGLQRVPVIWEWGRAIIVIPSCPLCIQLFCLLHLHRCRRTISMETGFQNIQLCSTILNVTFPPEVIGPLFFFPLLYMIFQLVEGLLFITVFRCYEKIKPPKGEYQPPSSLLPYWNRVFQHISSSNF